MFVSKLHTPHNAECQLRNLQYLKTLLNSPTPLSAFLQWTAYPPDANHGFYVPSGVLTAVLLSGAQVPSPSVSSSSSLSSLFLDNAKSFPVRVYSEALLVTMPTPDFSMPYNVICLVSTAVAIAFGTVHNQVRAYSV